MQDRWNAGQKGCRTGGMQDRKSAGKVGCRTGEMQDGRDAGQEIIEMQDRWGVWQEG